MLDDLSQKMNWKGHAEWAGGGGDIMRHMCPWLEKTKRAEKGDEREESNTSLCQHKSTTGMRRAIFEACQLQHLLQCFSSHYEKFRDTTESTKKSKFQRGVFCPSSSKRASLTFYQSPCRASFLNLMVKDQSSLQSSCPLQLYFLLNKTLDDRSDKFTVKIL